MEALNTDGTQPSSYNQNSNIAKQFIKTTIITQPPSLKASIEGARPINDTLRSIIDQVKRQASPPLTDVIDFRNELRERYERNIMEVPIKLLRFRKNNGRIIADVESYELEHQCKLDETTDETQNILRGFLLNNDKERNEELKRLLTHKGQQRPAIATCDGFLINGNRRKMALEELYRKGSQDSRFENMRVILLPEGVSELEIQQIENRYQLQNEGKSEYQGLNRAIKYMRNIQNGFSLEAQLKDDPNYHELSAAEFNKKVKEFEKNFINPLVCIDRYLGTLGRERMYNTITESISDREGRWQAFVDYSNFYNSTLANPSKLAQLQLGEGDVGKLETAIFKLIRKRNLNSKHGDSPVGKLHEFIRKLPKYLANTDATESILRIAEVPDDIPEEAKYDKQGNRHTEREIDTKWGAMNETDVLNNLFQAQRHLTNQEARDKPLELLEDSLRKLNHNNLRIENMGAEYYEKGMELARTISQKSEEIYQTIDHARDNYYSQTEKAD
jgi:hypothetical protein